MRLVFICQAVDEDHPALATEVRRIRTLATRPRVRRVQVIALRSGRFTLPDNVSVRDLGGGPRLLRLFAFYVEVFRALSRGVDAFYICRSGPYPALLLPFRLLLRKPVYQWYNHPHIGAALRLYARFCDTKIFTPTPSAFPLRSPKVHIVGAGQDTARFRPTGREPDSDVVTVGRIAPVKGLESAIRLVAECGEKNGRPYGLDIYGVVYEQERTYYQTLVKLTRELRMSERVRLHDPVKQDDLPGILGRHRVFLSFSDAGLDQTLQEAMACGVPVLSTNQRLRDLLPEDLRSLLILPLDDRQTQVEMLHRVLAMSRTEREQLGKAERELIVRDHSIEAQFDRIVAEMGAPD